MFVVRCTRGSSARATLATTYGGSKSGSHRWAFTVKPDDGAPARHRRRLGVPAPAVRADRHGRVHQLAAVAAALDAQDAVRPGGPEPFVRRCQLGERPHPCPLPELRDATMPRRNATDPRGSVLTSTSLSNIGHMLRRRRPAPGPAHTPAVGRLGARPRPATNSPTVGRNVPVARTSPSILTSTSMLNDMLVVDADSHWCEAPDLFTKRAPGRLPGPRPAGRRGRRSVDVGLRRPARRALQRGRRHRA